MVSDSERNRKFVRAITYRISDVCNCFAGLQANLLSVGMPSNNSIFQLSLIEISK